MKITSTFVLAAVLAFKTSGVLALPFSVNEVASFDARDAGVLSEIDFEAREFDEGLEVDAREFDDEFEVEARDFEDFEELDARAGGATAATPHTATTHPTTHVASAGKPAAVDPAKAFFSNEIKAQEAQLHRDQTALQGLEHPHISTAAHGTGSRPTLNRATSLHAGSTGLHPPTGASHQGSRLSTGRPGSRPLSTGRRPASGLRGESRLSAQGAVHKPVGLHGESRLGAEGTGRRPLGGLRGESRLREETGRRPIGGQRGESRLSAQGRRPAGGRGESRLSTHEPGLRPTSSRLANSRAGAHPETAAQRAAAVRIGQENKIESNEQKLEHEIRLEQKLASLQG